MYDALENIDIFFLYVCNWILTTKSINSFLCLLCMYVFSLLYARKTEFNRLYAEIILKYKNSDFKHFLFCWKLILFLNIVKEF